MALAAGARLARVAWREAPLPLVISAAGWTAVVVAGRGDLPPDAAAPLGWTGLALVLLMGPSKLAALHRLAAGGEARDPLCAGGLQWTALEARLSATAVALAAAGALLAGAMGVAAAAVLAELGPFGPAAAVVLLTPAAALAASVIGRFCVTLAADAAEAGPRFARGWLLTRGAGAAPALVWALTFVLPSAALLVVPDRLDALGGGSAAAAVAGAVLAAATQLLFAPLNAGALAELRRAGLAREAAAAPVDTPEALGDKAAPASPCAPQPEPLPA